MGGLGAPTIQHWRSHHSRPDHQTRQSLPEDVVRAGCESDHDAPTPMVRLQFRPVADRGGRPYATKQSGHRTCQQTRSNRLEPTAARHPVRRAKRRDHGSDLTPSTVTKEFAIERTAWNGEDTPPESDGPLGHYGPCR